MDVVDAATRSRMMSRIKAKNTKPEILIRRALHARGLRFRVHARNLPGHPDLVFPGLNSVILIHGCFWHGHDCHLYKLPATRREWWKAKIAGNRRRDRRTEAALAAEGWRTLTIWECTLRGQSQTRVDAIIDRVSLWLRNPRMRSAVLRSARRRAR